MRLTRNLERISKPRRYLGKNSLNRSGAVGNNLGGHKASEDEENPQIKITKHRKR